MPMQFRVTGKHFIGLSPETMAAAGVDPARQIVPAWFGFRTTVDAVPTSCPIEVSGRSQFKLFINGESILFGPCRSVKEVAYYDTIDIAPWLKEGENRILMQVFSYPENPPMFDRANQGPNYCYGDNGGPAVSLDGRIGDRDPGEPENWNVWIDDGMGFNGYAVFLLGANEVVDGGKSLANPLLGDDWSDSRLLAAAHVQPMTYDPFGCRHGKVFTPRPIPLLYRKEKSFPDWRKRTIPAHSSESFVIDAGELTTAYFRVGFEGGAGSKVQLMYAESYFKKDADGKAYKGVRDDTSGYIDGVYDEYTVGGDAVYDPFRFRTFRFVKITVETADAPLTVVPKAYIETAYPFENTKKPRFGDKKKEKLYDVAFRTLQLCAHDTYEDCPYYEQLMYACDTRLEILFTYAATDDVELPRQAIRLFGSSLQAGGFTQARFPSREDQIIPMFSLYFVLMLEDYVEHTGDLDFVRPYIPTAERIVETFLSKRCSSGLIAPQGYWDYFDWAQAWAETNIANTPTAVLDGESALQNLFFVYAVQSLCRLLPKFDRADLAAHLGRECDAILRIVDERCFDSARGLYREGPNTDEYSQHSQVFAVLVGLADGERARSMMEKVLDDPSLIPCSFMQKYYLFRALEKAGMYDRTEELWQAWQDFIDLHCTTFPETPFDPRSDCHAWSALPLFEFADKR